MAGSPPVRLQLLGRPGLHREGAPSLAFGPERRLQLLALLGFEAGWVGRDRLAALFWPGRDSAAARANLRKVLHELRALGIEGLEEAAAGLRWRPPSDIGSARDALQAGRWAEAATLGAGVLMIGLDGARGSPAFDDWLQLERQQWTSRWRDAALQAVAGADAARAWRLAGALLDADALDEEAVAIALRAAAALGRPDQAQAVWQQYRQRLADELGIAPTQALAALAAGHGSAAPSWRAATEPLSPWVGREQEQRLLARLVAQSRLVTIIGPGGVGKTRLARQAALSLGSGFAEGATFVPLDGLSTPSALPARIAAALGLSLTTHGDPVDALGRQLAQRSLLLLLDGFEPLIDAADGMPRLLGAAPGVRFVVTSRERLDVDGECLLPLAGLPLPKPGASPGASGRSDAVVLFTTRALAVNPAFDGTAAHAAVVEICRRVDGLPLALELAADWARLMPASDIAREIADGIDLLGGSGRQGNSMRSVFEQSWQLLTPAEKNAFAALAVFRGGFTRDAARQVAGVALPLLAALADKSMLRVAADGRFDMHALLHAWALEKFAALPQCAALAERHSRWFIALMSRPGAVLGAERENLLAAWRQAVERRDTVAVEAALLDLPWTALNEGRLAERAAWFDEAAQTFAQSQGGAITAAALRAHQAWLLLWLERYREATAMALSAGSILATAGHATGSVMALRTLGHAARREGQHAQAVAYFTQALALAQQAGLVAFEAALHDALAMALNMQGEFAAARLQIGRALELNEARGDGVQRMYNHYNLSQSHSLAGEPALALPCAEAALALGEQLGQAFMRPYLEAELARVRADLGQTASAADLAALALAHAEETGDRAAQTAAREVLARIAVARAAAATRLETPAKRLRS